MTSNILATDSKLIRIRNFEACLGVTLEIHSPEEFKNSYFSFFEKIKSDYGLKTPRCVFKSYDLKKMIRQNFNQIVENFIQEVISHNCTVYVVFASFNTRKIPEVRYYSLDRKRNLRTKKTIEFLRHLSNYFPYIATWEVWLNINDESKDFETHIDLFDGEVTHAWTMLSQNVHLKVFPKGDQCNPFISSSDIVVSFIENNILEKNIRLDRSQLESLLEKYSISCKALHCGSNKIKYISPILNTRIPEPHYFVEPVIYIITEDILKDESKWIENSPSFEYVLKYAEMLNGGVKFLDRTRDHKFIRTKDILIYLGHRGKDLAEYISNLYSIEHMNISKLIAEVESNRKN